MNIKMNAIDDFVFTNKFWHWLAAEQSRMGMNIIYNQGPDIIILRIASPIARVPLIEGYTSTRIYGFVDRKSGIVYKSSRIGQSGKMEYYDEFSRI